MFVRKDDATAALISVLTHRLNLVGAMATLGTGTHRWPIITLLSSNMGDGPSYW